MDSGHEEKHVRAGPLTTGDLMLLFTDGLTDNLHWHEVLRKVDEVVEQHSAGRKETVRDGLWAKNINKICSKPGFRPRNVLAIRLGATGRAREGPCPDS